jgi:hypothetical protein
MLPRIIPAVSKLRSANNFFPAVTPDIFMRFLTHDLYTYLTKNGLLTGTAHSFKDWNIQIIHCPANMDKREGYSEHVNIKLSHDDTSRVTFDFYSTTWVVKSVQSGTADQIVTVKGEDVEEMAKKLIDDIEDIMKLPLTLKI